MMMISLAVTFSLVAVHVHGHGFFVHPGPKSEAYSDPGVRNYDAISYNIDSLRNPNTAGLCRGAQPGKVTNIQLSNGVPFTITMAFSVGAQHVGPCAVEIFDRDSPASAVQIASLNNCAVPPTSPFDTNKGGPASSQCPGSLPAKLVTDDMCLSEWTFTPANVDKISCSNCVMRWTWIGQHVPQHEPYENCADVRISGVSGGSKGTENNETPSQPDKPTTSESSDNGGENKNENKYEKDGKDQNKDENKNENKYEKDGKDQNKDETKYENKHEKDGKDHNKDETKHENKYEKDDKDQHKDDDKGTHVVYDERKDPPCPEGYTKQYVSAPYRLRRRTFFECLKDTTTAQETTTACSDASPTPTPSGETY